MTEEAQLPPAKAIKHMLYCRFLKCVLLNFFSNVGQRCRYLNAYNMTMDGFCDHTSMIADDEILQHYTEINRNSDTIIYGRVTYQLMEFWQTVVNNPTGKKSMDEFAASLDNISKIVFSNTLQKVEWPTAKLAKRSISEEVSELKLQTGKDILVGSRSLIVALLNLNLIDEFQLSVHPVVAGKGLPLFNNINEKTTLKLVKTKTFRCGAVTLYYESTKK